MQADIVVVIDKCTNTFFTFRDILVPLDIYILVFDRAPEPLDIDVVQRASLAVHRQLRRACLVLEKAGKLL